MALVKCEKLLPYNTTTTSIQNINYKIPIIFQFFKIPILYIILDKTFSVLYFYETQSCK